ncbi:hydantoinase B/oxoprolinase family protein [Nocardia cyriacigeorgica]|uniref:hydantoinase B/oxoprolinase family protein n=1 Tax=Nocardia cyriacigeorgica TaxID=135487 RepID=UPI001895BEF8|nr:hydantoinase B/oxoprolinase family protein [Nocardia cyriacigeorgica]MBF6428491.1 hydantoinase B/oxoprolinase family protein [Nocardia cyriacigeorgica]
MSTTFDPFDLEIIGEHLTAVADEMFVTTTRTAQSAMIYEVLDFSVGITDPDGRLVDQGNGLTILLRIFGERVRGALAQFPADTLVDGDIIMTNDPYGPGGSHLNDMTLVMPVFVDGQIVAFTCNQAHWADVGGKDPGSVSVDAGDIFQEGLQVPFVKIFKAGTLDDEIARILAANSRLPGVAMGDLHAQAASVRIGAKRIKEICARLGVGAFRASVDKSIAETTELALAELRRIPAGTYRAHDTITFGGHEARACVAVTISDTGIICDFTGTDPQIGNLSVNCGGGGLLAAASVAFKALIGPHVPVNEGIFSPLTVECPAGTVFTAKAPSALSIYFQGIAVAADLIWRALAEAAPDRLPAGHYLDAGIVIVAGPSDGPGGMFIMNEPNPGGWGAAHDCDGQRGLVAIHGGHTLNIPVEVLEQRYPIQINQYALDTSPGGSGEWRGGEGVIREYAVKTDWAMIASLGNNRKDAPWPVAGGEPGTRTRCEVVRVDGTVEVHHESTRIDLRRGDIARLITGKGGGWGRPADRDPARVAADIRDGFVRTGEPAASHT